MGFQNQGAPRASLAIGPTWQERKPICPPLNVEGRGGTVSHLLTGVSELSWQLNGSVDVCVAELAGSRGWLCGTQVAVGPALAEGRVLRRHQSLDSVLRKSGTKCSNRMAPWGEPVHGVHRSSTAHLRGDVPPGFLLQRATCRHVTVTPSFVKLEFPFGSNQKSVLYFLCFWRRQGLCGVSILRV